MEHFIWDWTKPIINVCSGITLHWHLGRDWKEKEQHRQTWSHVAMAVPRFPITRGSTEQRGTDVVLIKHWAA